jgi:FkbM family methyltransferase
VNKLVEIEKRYRAGRIGKKAYINLVHKLHLALWEYLDFIKNKNISDIEIDQNRITLRTKSGIRLICDPLDKRHIAMEILNFGDHEPAELQMIRRFLKKDSIVLDIGANIGWYAINLSKSVPQGRIIAFEPIPKTYEYLTKNTALNNLHNIKAYNIGLSSKAGYFNFYYNQNYAGATSLASVAKQDNMSIVKCKVEKLDGFLKKVKIREIDFIKCDVEGAEKFLIQGGKQAFNEKRPIFLMEL